MDKETFLSKLKEIGTIEDEVQRRTIIADITDTASNLFDKEEVLETENNQYKSDNETLRQANMQLFLKVGAVKTDDEIQRDKTGVDQSAHEPRKFEELFNEKGMIK